MAYEGQEIVEMMAEIATDNVPSRELSPITESVDQWVELKSLVLDSVTSPHSRRAYSKALDCFFEWWESEGKPPFTKATVQAYRVKLESDGLAGSTINVRLAAIRKLA